MGAGMAVLPPKAAIYRPGRDARTGRLGKNMLNSAGLTSSCLLKLHLAGLLCAGGGYYMRGRGEKLRSQWTGERERESMKNIKKSESDSWLGKAAGVNTSTTTPDVRLLKASGTGFTHTDAHRR